ncbi:class I SAM-dependent methyltransferase [Cellulosilyticum ruminicola]|uniref:class I SAM-dependent methyltransferase n=1 Tax=Cellulosilyticum ruminicola TaxID=425254 RepID=UPI0006D24DD7|nr:class I SAM-dependent methyltransferase [Cellulosilyticum ruminicola]
MKNAWSGFKGRFWGKVFASPSLRFIFGFYIFSNKHTRMMKKEIKVNFKGNTTLVDLGAGSGYFTSIAAKTNPNGKIIAVDLSDMMINRLKENLNKKGLGANVTIKKEQIEHTTIKDNSADVIILSNVLHELIDPKNIVNEMNRILKKGGIILASEFIDNPFGRKFLSHHDNEVHGPYSVEEIQHYFGKCGYFREVKIDTDTNRILAIIKK